MIVFDVKEGETATYEATLVDAQDPPLPIPLSALLTLTLTLYDAARTEPDPANANIINGRDAQDVLNAHDVTYDGTSGKLTWAVQAADTVIRNPYEAFERHVALFTYTFAGVTGTSNGKHEVALRVRNLRKV